MAAPATLGELRRAVENGSVPHRTVKDELRDNLIEKLRADARLFPGIVGYDDSVIPQIVNAILSRHNFILLGLRGQAKTRILRALEGGRRRARDRVAPARAAVRGEARDAGRDDRGHDR